MGRKLRILRRVVVALVVLLLVAQAVPYGRDHENPPVTGEPSWNSPRTEALVRHFCFDCHSNETRWPWYSHVAPISWLVQSDVEEGRQHLNFSQMDKGARHARDAAEQVEEGEMPPWQYTFGRSDRQMSAKEKKDLVAGLKATFSD
jgi:hypothetical protein